MEDGKPLMNGKQGAEGKENRPCALDAEQSFDQPIGTQIFEHSSCQVPCCTLHLLTLCLQQASGQTSGGGGSGGSSDVLQLALAAAALRPRLVVVPILLPGK